MNPIRARIEPVLAETGAFLRCDRGGALYVTNLPSRTGGWQARLAPLDGQDIAWRAEAGLVFFTPGTSWAQAFDQWLLERVTPGDLTRQLEKRRLFPFCGEEEACWLEGIKRLDLPRGACDYEKKLRQCAAVALRKQSGGLLASCGLCLDALKEMVL